MTSKPNRRDVLKSVATLAAVRFGAAPAGAAPSRAEIDSVLQAAVQAGDVPGVVALAANDSGLVYEGMFGERRLPGGPAMTRDTVFRIASMVKAITSVAALAARRAGASSRSTRRCRQIEPALERAQVLDGFNATGVPQLRAAKSPITLRQLLTHTAGFTYRLWDAKALRYVEAVGKLPASSRGKLPRTPLMFDPGERWQYGAEHRLGRPHRRDVSGEPVDAYFRKHILGPLGMNDTGFVDLAGAARARSKRASARGRTAHSGRCRWKSRSRAAIFTGGGGIYSTAPDYLTFLRMLMQGGTLDGVAHPASGNRGADGPEPDRGRRRGRAADDRTRILQRRRFVSRHTCKWGFGHMITMQAVPAAAAPAA